MRCCYLAASLLLAGCAWTKAPVVRVPVPVSCVEKRPERPRLVTEAELKAMPDGQAIPALEQHRVLSEPYIAELEAIVETCATAVGPALPTPTTR